MKTQTINLDKVAGTRTVCFRVEPALHRIVKRQAKRLGISMTEFTRLAIEHQLPKLEAELKRDLVR